MSPAPSPPAVPASSSPRNTHPRAPSKSPASSRRRGSLPAPVNVLPGTGSVAGAALARHRDVDKICFTGSVEVGQRILRDAAAMLKQPLLELGGKGPNLIFEDADLEAAVQGSFFAAFHNQGQACIAGSRIYLHEALWEPFLKKFLGRAQSLRIGGPPSAHPQVRRAN